MKRHLRNSSDGCGLGSNNVQQPGSSKDSFPIENGSQNFSNELKDSGSDCHSLLMSKRHLKSADVDTFRESTRETDKMDKLEEKESAEQYCSLKKRFNLKELSVIVRGLSPRQLELLRRKAELERLLVRKIAKLSRTECSKSMVNIAATSTNAEGISCPVPDCRFKPRFETESELEIHRKRCHEGVKKPFSCQSCSKSFLTERVLEDHMNTHRGEKPYLCSSCGFAFSSKDGLGRHQHKAHSAPRRKRIFTCKHCKDKFESRKLWEIHCLTHLPPEERAEADRIEEERKTMKKRKLGEKNLFCHDCDFKARYPSQLKEHVRIHSSMRTWSCQVCGKGFKRNRALTVHMAVHTDYRPFLCTYCGKAFKLKKTLATHLHLHESDKSYACPMCPKQYQTRSLLNQHVMSHEKKSHPVCPLQQQAAEVSNFLSNIDVF